MEAVVFNFFLLCTFLLAFVLCTVVTWWLYQFFIPTPTQPARPGTGIFLAVLVLLIFGWRFLVVGALIWMVIGFGIWLKTVLMPSPLSRLERLTHDHQEFDRATHSYLSSVRDLSSHTTKERRYDR